MADSLLEGVMSPLERRDIVAEQDKDDIPASLQHQSTPAPPSGADIDISGVNNPAPSSSNPRPLLNPFDLDNLRALHNTKLHASSDARHATASSFNSGHGQFDLNRNMLAPIPGSRKMAASSGTAPIAAQSSHNTFVSSSNSRRRGGSVVEDHELEDALPSDKDETRAHPSTVPLQATDSVVSTLDVGPRKRSKAPGETPRKRSKRSTKEHHGRTEQSGDLDDIEGNISLNIQAKNEDNAEPTDQIMPYRSYRVIKLPERSNQHKKKSNERMPQKDDPSTWYGTMPYKDSMITFWCDEMRLSYEKTQSNIKVEGVFPEGLTMEQIRKRHLAALEKQLKIYGFKDAKDIPVPTEVELRRGRPHQCKSSGEATQGSNRDARGSARPTLNVAQPEFVRDAPFRQLEMTSIVVFKDLLGMSFEQIRSTMNKNFDWVLERNQIVQYYNFARPSAYGSKSGNFNIDDCPDQEEVQENPHAQEADSLVRLAQGATSSGREVAKKEKDYQPLHLRSKGSGGQKAIGSVKAHAAAENTTVRAPNQRELEAGQALLQLKQQPTKTDEAMRDFRFDHGDAESDSTLDMKYGHDQ